MTRIGASQYLHLLNLRLAILIGSVAVNAALAVLLFRDHSTGVAQDGSQPSMGNGQTPVESSVHKSKRSLVGDANTAEARAGAAATAHFSWSQLESADYKEYIARLRAFGVPEKTIRDLIMADIAKLYRPRFAALRPPKKPNDKFWEQRNMWGGGYGNQTKEQREQQRALYKEQSELVKSLLGPDVYDQQNKESGYPDWNERVFGVLPKDQMEKVSDIRSRYDEARAEIYAKAEGYIDQDTQADLKKLDRKMREELGAILTPEQLENYELRTSDVANNMRWQLSAFEPGEDEFKAIFKYKRAEEEWQAARNNEDKPPTADERKALQEQQKAASDELAKALGADRLKEYKLLDDWSYRNLVDAGVAKESVFKVADMKQTAEDAARKLRQDKTLTPEQRNDALKAIRDETQKALTGLLGERVTKAYKAQGGWWLRNLAPSE